MMLTILVKLFFFEVVNSADQSSSISQYHKDRYLINEYFRGGEQLVYNCQDKYFACIDEESLSNCNQHHKMCVPIKKFLTMDECFDRQRDVMQLGKESELCHRWKKLKKEY